MFPPFQGAKCSTASATQKSAAFSVEAKNALLSAAAACRPLLPAGDHCEKRSFW
jgi:hypothetical protein